jgi:hypothetical protein
MTQPNATRSKTAAELKANPEPAQRTGKILIVDHELNKN